MIETVIKADGTEQPFDANKINRWGQYAAKQGGDWSSIVMETVRRLPKKVSSKDIHQKMIDVCIEKEDITYSRIAARLQLAIIRKAMDKHILRDDSSFLDLSDKYFKLGLWDKRVFPEQDSKWNDWYSELRTFKLDYWQIKQFMDKYGIAYEGDCVETPHVAALALSLAHLGDCDDAFEMAKAIIQGKINLPTPAINGGRNGDFDSVSCCVITGGDTVDSIGVANHIAYKMTAKKAGIGIEMDTRSKGADVKGGRVKHLGKHSLYEMIDKSVKAMTQITRGGNATVSFKCIDPEIMEMLLWKTQKIDMEKRIDKLDYSFVYNDAFVEAVVKDDDWFLFDLKSYPSIHKAFYGTANQMESFKSEIWDAYLKSDGDVTKVKAREMLKLFLTARQETGRIYCFNATQANTHTPFTDTIRLSNLCVAPETVILTDKGYFPISELEGEKVQVWNGEEFSETIVQKTGTNQKLVKVITDSGQELECTEYHKFYVKPSYDKKEVVKRAHELVSGDKLIKFELPTIEGSKELHKAYQNGFYTGDGTEVNGNARIYLYHEKKKLLPLFNLSQYSESSERISGVEEGLKNKFFVPNSEYSIQSRLGWLSGWLDADGCIYRNGRNEQLVGTSVEKEFLKEVQLMLQTLGVDSKIKSQSEEGNKLLPANDGTGETKEFFCKKAYRLIITSNGLFRLHQLGIKFHRLSTTERLPQRDAKHFIKVVEVIDEDRYDDTYCFTEAKRGMGMFGGLLTGQCQEIMLPTKPYLSMSDLYSWKSQGETAFCSLAAINVGKVESMEYRKIAELALRFVDSMIEKAPAMSHSMEESIRRRRSVGIGITGLAQFLYKNGEDYSGSPRSFKLVSELAEHHYYYLLEASQEMAKESGGGVLDIDCGWLPIDTGKIFEQPCLNWEQLRGKPRRHSVLVAHMPTESSSVFSGAVNGLYPPRDKVIYKQARQGLIQFILEKDDFIPAWDVENILLSKYYARIQTWTDQGISSDYYAVPERYPNGKVPLSQLMKEWVAQARLGVKTMYYVNTKPNKSVTVQDMLESSDLVEKEDEGCDGGCKL